MSAANRWVTEYENEATGLARADWQGKWDQFAPMFLLDGIPGVNKSAAATFIAEMGVNMSVFKSAKHLASWAGVSPGNYERPVKKNK
ncbi:transposase [Peribacillus frigoritolerans]|uniref:transposase n=1 Tax=Peribacillus frigoritolerans TaxID=450367 RepID=UPI00300A0081